MSAANVGEPARRDFLRMGVTITAGLVVPAALQGCNGGGDAYVPPAETFVEPLTIRSVNGVLDVTLVIAYLTTVLDGATVTLRNFYGTIPAPTLRVGVGDTLRIKVVNNLPPNPPSTEPMSSLHYPNSTNLHTHGLHVYPGIIAAPSGNDPGLYGDYVVDDPAQGIQPGETRQYEYRIREDHPAGTYWYHPHMHGSSAMQVGSGMAGALIVTGPIDRVPEIAAAQEHVFMFQAPFHDAEGKVEYFGYVAKHPQTEPKYLINGVRVPRIVMRTGEVQNWRFINAAIWKYLNLSLDGHVMYQYSHDGNPRRDLRPVAPVAVPPPLPPGVDPSPPYPDGVVLAPANRSNVLIKAGPPGTYYLRTMLFEVGRDSKPILEDTLAEIVVVDDPRPMSLPTPPLPVTPFLAPITDQELAAHGGLKRTIVMRVISSLPAPTPPDPPFTGAAATPLVQPPPGELHDWVFQGDYPQGSGEQTTIANKVYALGTAGTTASANPGMPTTFIPFQSSKSLTQSVVLDSVEEWTIINMNNIRHPFHIHVNPMYVVAVNGKPIEPYWADTVGLPNNDQAPPGLPGPTPSSITFRMRFLHFTGPYVMHCHMLVHEDMGMMQGVTVT